MLTRTLMIRAVSIVSLLLCVVTVVLWNRSFDTWGEMVGYSWPESSARVETDHTAAIVSLNGGLFWVRTRTANTNGIQKAIPSRYGFFHRREVFITTPYRIRKAESLIGMLGFGGDSYHDQGVWTYDETSVGIPLLVRSYGHGALTRALDLVSHRPVASATARSVPGVRVRPSWNREPMPRMRADCKVSDDTIA